MSDTERPLERARGAPLELADTRRIQALVDGVFAIVMTLLVLTIKVPTVVGPVSDAVLRRALVDMLPGLGIYGITFLLLGLMWYSNRRSFSVIARGDAALRGLTIVWLMLVAMLPFTTSLNSAYLGLRVPAVLFHVNMLLIGTLSLLTWVYASKSGLLHKSVGPAARAAIGRSNWVLPAVPVLALSASLVSPMWSAAVYLAAPLARWALGRTARPAHGDAE